MTMIQVMVFYLETLFMAWCFKTSMIQVMVFYQETLFMAWCFINTKTFPDFKTP
ncbi:hypothetical protein Hdeb2414_s0088g00786181 [Helianthus debilis subsp. tardiflorus]